MDPELKYQLRHSENHPPKRMYFKDWKNLHDATQNWPIYNKDYAEINHNTVRAERYRQAKIRKWGYYYHIGGEDCPFAPCDKLIPELMHHPLWQDFIFRIAYNQFMKKGRKWINVPRIIDALAQNRRRRKSIPSTPDGFPWRFSIPALGRKVAGDYFYEKEGVLAGYIEKPHLKMWGETKDYREHNLRQIENYKLLARTFRHAIKKDQGFVETFIKLMDEHPGAGGIHIIAGSRRTNPTYPLTFTKASEFLT